jgi:hypothetical protein
MKHKIEFEKKVTLNLIQIVPIATVDKHYWNEWGSFIGLFVPHKKVKVTIEWEDDETLDKCEE